MAHLFLSAKTHGIHQELYAAYEAVREGEADAP